jgi:type VI secretion system protein ImpH
MAGQNRRSPTGLKRPPKGALQDDLIEQGHSYAFFQAIRLLRRMGGSVDDQSGEKKAIRVRPSLNLSFPAADIDRIDRTQTDAGEAYRITANFLGLYGTASPLPTFYTEDLMAEANEDESVSRDFLDIIHARLYGLLFSGWMKYRQFLQVTEERSTSHIERLFCLLGLGEKALRDNIQDPDVLLRYVGLFTQFPRSAVGLATVLKDALEGVPTSLEPCILRMATIPESQRLKMGRSGNILGETAYVGQEIADRMGKFRLQLGPLTQADFLRFTPGNPGYAKLVTLTELYVTEPFEYEVELILAPNQAQTVCLGDPVRSVLGVTTWVFSESSLGEVRTRFAVNRS